MQTTGDPATPPRVDPAVLTRFGQEYLGAPNARGVFDKYLPLLGAPAMLGFLERQYPSCHGRAHELGKALFAASRNLGAVLRECGNGCTSGCMHGAVAEAFGDENPDGIMASMNRFCAEGEISRLHRPGNCAHAVGHALMLATNGDVGRSVDGCLGFTPPAMAYYCTAGVYMERLEPGLGAGPPPSSLYDPCDRETLFPAACYRYRAFSMLSTLGSRAHVAQACLRLDGLQRLGCFHGVGNTAFGAVFGHPDSLRMACGDGSRDDRLACIEGTIEKLADVDERRAKAACGKLNGDLRSACTDAAERKMYDLSKPTFRLYFDSGAIAERRGTLTRAKPAGAPSAGHD